MQARPTNSGSVFCHLSGRPVSRYQVSSVFNLALKIPEVDIYLVLWILLYLSFFGSRTIRILGSSIVKHAFCYARKYKFDANLELDLHNATIFWQGKGVMWVDKICSSNRTLHKVQIAPSILVIHCWGNNIPVPMGAKTSDRCSKSATKWIKRL